MRVRLAGAPPLPQDAPHGLRTGHLLSEQQEGARCTAR